MRKKYQECEKDQFKDVVILFFRAVDPDSSKSDPDTDPDPAFQVNPDDQKLKEIGNLQQKFCSIIAIYLCPIHRRNLQPSKETMQHFKKLNLLTFSHVCGSFLPSWIH
jgi:hypothetical protein